MKIIIFENEYISVKGAFETANLMEFDGKLNINIFSSSQKADFNNIDDYMAIFVDIDLSPRSNLDGFGIIDKIAKIDPKLLDKTIILTGNNKIKEAMVERKIYYPNIKIIVKPTTFYTIINTLKSIKSTKE